MGVAVRIVDSKVLLVSFLNRRALFDIPSVGRLWFLFFIFTRLLN